MVHGFEPSSGGDIGKFSINGGAVALFNFANNPLLLAADMASVYWVDAGVGGTTPYIARMGLSGEAPSYLAFLQSRPTGMTISATHAYWTEAGGIVAKVPLAGGTPVVLASGQASPTGIAVDSTNVYWTNSGDGTIKKVSK